MSFVADVDRLQSFLDVLNKGSKGPEVTLKDFVVKAASNSCLAVKECNSLWLGTHIRFFKDVNIAVNVKKDKEFKYFVVEKCQSKGVQTIQDERLQAEAEDSEVQLFDFENHGQATFTVNFQDDVLESAEIVQLD